MTVGAFDEVADDPGFVLHPGSKELPTYLEVVRVVDLSARFKGAKTFVEDASREIEKFYQDAGQHLSKWVPQAPKVRHQKEPETVLPAIFSSASRHVNVPSTILNESIDAPQLSVLEKPPMTHDSQIRNEAAD